MTEQELKQAVTDLWKAAFVVALVGFLFGMVFQSQVSNSEPRDRVEAAIAECQKDLPRSQSCTYEVMATVKPQ